MVVGGDFVCGDLALLIGTKTEPFLLQFQFED